MSEQVDAIYDDGVLKPVTPLLLPDKARVTLTINEQSPKFGQDEWERRLLGVAKDCGVSLSDLALSSEGLYE
jgi:predicted DNA-binding antitoxin AbrB/MazE fold protein